MITLLFQRHFHVFFFTVVLSFNIFTNTSLGIRYAGSGSTEFIRQSCKATLYPALCYNSLSIYANSIQTNPRLLADTALSVSLSATQNTSSFMRKQSRGPEIKPRDVGPMRDCLKVLGDAVHELKDSIAEMAHINNDKNFRFLMSNIQTWVSAALTNEDTCTDGFSQKAMDSKVKMVVTQKIKSIAQLTSNALALINNYASDHV
uniref:Pectinesterase inhibitor domain-containing protein n=1 Tax=Opuntia streptacantha TaxID=393608 RepID=A0A7C8YJL3_OPUST